MITITTLQLNAWIAGLLWPLTRILGLITAAPVLGHRSVPITVKVVLGVLLAAIIAPTVPPVPALDPMGWAGLLVLAQELIIGLAMGFSIRLVFAALELAGEVSSLTMGLGFATFFDPSSSGRSSAIGQFLTLVATMAFLALNAHLALIEALAESFVTLPMSGDPLALSAPLDVARLGARVFSAGLQIAMPVVAALLVANVALAVLTRAAPQLNLFGVGFAITISVGLLSLALVLPYLSTPLANLFNEGIEAARATARSAAARPPALAAPRPPRQPM